MLRRETEARAPQLRLRKMRTHCDAHACQRRASDYSPSCSLSATPIPRHREDHKNNQSRIPLSSTSLRVDHAVATTWMCFRLNSARRRQCANPDLERTNRQEEDFFASSAFSLGEYPQGFPRGRPLTEQPRPLPECPVIAFRSARARPRYSPSPEHMLIAERRNRCRQSVFLPSNRDRFGRWRVGLQQRFHKYAELANEHLSYGAR